MIEIMTDITKHSGDTLRKIMSDNFLNNADKRLKELDINIKNDDSEYKKNV